MKSLPHQKCSPEMPQRPRNGSTVLLPEKPGRMAATLRVALSGPTRDASLEGRSGRRSGGPGRTKELGNQEGVGRRLLAI
jgi:hypothetical protein